MLGEEALFGRWFTSTVAGGGILGPVIFGYSFLGLSSMMLTMSNSNTTQETLEIMKESEKRLVEESVNKSKCLSRSPSKEEVEKETDESYSRQESQRRTPNHSHARKRAKSNSKLKLVRSLAVCEESGYFVDDHLETQEIIQLHISCPSDKEDEKSSKDTSEKEEKERNNDKGPKKMLSRDSSQEYTDSTGIDVHEFLVNTLKNNPRDRMMLLKLEQEILEFINDNSNQFKKFPQMTSYHRMLLHRVAAYFGMDHNVDQTGKAVIINKTGTTRIPEQRFSEHIKDEKSCDFQQRFILKRDDASMDRDDNQMRVPLQDGRRSKSIEEREEEYQRVRERIFAREQSAQNGYLPDSRVNRDGLIRASSSRQSSTDSEMKSLEPRPWSSTDSDGSIRSMRPPVTKASSFSGISILTRGDSIGSVKGTTCRTNRPGLSLVAPDVCNQVSSSQSLRSLMPCTAQQHPLQPAPQQQPLGNHMMSQSDDHISNHFGQMSLSRQGSTEAPDASSAMYPTPLMSQHPPQTGFIMASTGPAIPGSSYPASAHPSSTQQVLPPQGYMQPPQQIQVSYFTPGQYPNSSPQYRPLSHQVAYSPQRTQQLPQPPQQSGLQPLMSNQQQQPPYQGLMGVQQPQNSSLISNQRTSMGNQMQGMMVQFTPLSSYQVPVGNESQGIVQQTYQQPVLVPANQTVQGGMSNGGIPIYYSVIPPAQQNGSSSSVGFLQPPGSEQYQMPSSPSPCSPSQIQPQFSGVSPSGPGMVVMQLNVPNGPQAAPQNSPMVQWSHCKYFGLDHRGQKADHLYNPDANTQASNQMTSPITSPAQSPTPSPVTNLSSVCTGMTSLPVLAQFSRPMVPAQGDGRYALLGQPLQYNLSVCSPLLHNQTAYSTHQAQTGMKHGNRGKRPALKSASTDLGTTDIVLGRVLEVTDLPEGITRAEADKLFTQLAMAGAKIQWLKDSQGRSGAGGDNGTSENGRHINDLAALYTIVAVFPSTTAAQSASLRLNSPVSRFKLRMAKKSYDLRILERASSQ
ncbi:R3H domain-containing protein 2 isoform X1 [Pleurodeles waltl]|uniref:R3H domain-containing protein 2 isoform X1 n=1 Tax=Pleurodeles waltl TaxID=8319 RepID=UPI003709588F